MSASSARIDPALLKLIVIVDAARLRGRDATEVAAAAARGGATMLQVRAKGLGAGEMAALTRAVLAGAGSVPVLVNDRLDVALATGAAGCHLGQDDFPIAAARTIAPASFLFGGSAGTSAEARAAAAQGAHYLGIGPIHSTPSKDDAGAAIGAAGFREVHAAAPEVPAVAIGGVSAADAADLVLAGAAGMAVISAVLDEADVEQATRELRQAWDAASRKP
ncbi:MAG TPA: thiamine phosphate synthase [Gemmatimonadales bacterium]|nr:thiamine phosphate synthase [Gemmatimonadales bacterium]